MANTPKAEFVKNKSGEIFSPVTHAKAVKLKLTVTGKDGVATNLDTNLQDEVGAVDKAWTKLNDDYLALVDDVKLADGTKIVRNTDGTTGTNRDYVVSQLIEEEHEKATVDSVTGAHGIHKTEDGTKLVFTDIDGNDYDIKFKTEKVPHTVMPKVVHAKTGMLPPVTALTCQIVTDTVKAYNTQAHDNWSPMGCATQAEADALDTALDGGDTTTINKPDRNCRFMGYEDCVGYFPSDATGINALCNYRSTNGSNEVYRHKTYEELEGEHADSSHHNTIATTRTFSPEIYDAENSTPYVALFWTDPDDTDTFKWKETRVVRKLGAPPENMYDGELVGYTSKDDQYGMTKNRFSTESSALLDFEYAVNKEYNEYVEEKCSIKENVLIMYYRWFVVAEDGYVYPNSNSSEYFGGVNLLKNIPTKSAVEGSTDANNADNSRYFKGCTRVVPGGVNLNKSPTVPMTSPGSTHYRKFMMNHFYPDWSEERQPLGYLATYITTNSAITFTSDPSFSTTSIEDFRGGGYTNADLSSIISRLMFPVVTDQAGNIMGSYSYKYDDKKADNIYYVYDGDSTGGRTITHLAWGGGGGIIPRIYPPLEACYMARHEDHFIDDKIVDPTETVYDFPVRPYLPDCHGYLRKMTYPEITYTTPLYDAIDAALLSAYEKVSVRNTSIGNFYGERTKHPEVETTTSFIRVTNNKGEDAKPKAEQDALNTTLTITNTNDKSWWYYPTTGYFHKNCENSVSNNPRCSLQSVTGMVVAKPEEDDPIVVTMSGYYSSNNVTLDSNVQPIEVPAGSSLQLEFMMCMPLVYYRITPMDTVTSSNYIEANELISANGQVKRQLNAIPGKNDTREYGKVLIEISKLPLHGFKPHPAFVHYTNVGTAENPVPKKVIVPYILMSPFGGTIMESDDTTSGSYTRFTGNGIFNDPTNNPIKPGDYNIERYNPKMGINRDITERYNSKLSTTIHLPPVNLAATLTSEVGIRHYVYTSRGGGSGINNQFPYLGYFNGIVYDPGNHGHGNSGNIGIGGIVSESDRIAEGADSWDVDLNHVTNMSITGGLPFCTPTSIAPVGENIEILDPFTQELRVYETSADRFNTIFRKAITNKGKSWHPATLSAMELIRLYYLIEFGTFDKYAMLEDVFGSALIDDGAVIPPNYVKSNWGDNSLSNDFASSFYFWGFKDKLENCDSTAGPDATKSCPLNFLATRWWVDDAAYLHQTEVLADNFYVSTYPQYTNSDVVTGAHYGGSNDLNKNPIPIKLTDLMAYAPFTTMCTGKLLLKYGFNNSWAISETRVTADSKVWTGSSGNSPTAPTGFFNLDLSFHGFDLNCLGIVDNQNWDYAVSHSIPQAISSTDPNCSVWDYIHTKEIQAETIPERQKTFFRDINNPDVKFPTSYNPNVVSESYPAFPHYRRNSDNYYWRTVSVVHWVPQTIRYSKDMDWVFLPGKPKWVNISNSSDFAPIYTPPGLWQIQSYWTNNTFPVYDKSTKTVGKDINTDPSTSKNVPIQDTDGMYDNSLLFYSPSSLSLNPQTLSSTVRSYSEEYFDSHGYSCITPQVAPNTAFTCHFMFVPRLSKD